MDSDALNLDFLRSFDLGICLGTDILQTLALELAVGVYPLLLLLLTYLLIRLYDRSFKPIVMIWKPFQAVLRCTKRKIKTKTTLIDAFCTFFLLTNAKLLSSCIDLLVPVTVYELNSTGQLGSSWRIYNNATIHYFGRQHLPYATLAAVVLLFLVLLPVLLLMLYPFRWFQNLLNRFPVRWYILHTFMDSFQGCYKDGTEPGTRDYRWCASVPFIARYLLFFVGIATFNSLFFPFASMILVITITLYVTLQPFKANRSQLTKLYANFLLLLAIGFSSAFGFSLLSERGPQLPFLAIMMTVVILPPLYLSAIIVHWVYVKRTFGLDVIKRLRARNRGYVLLDEV
jgi:hypothetical protein